MSIGVAVTLEAPANMANRDRVGTLRFAHPTYTVSVSCQFKLLRVNSIKDTPKPIQRGNNDETHHTNFAVRGRTRAMRQCLSPNQARKQRLEGSRRPHQVLIFGRLQHRGEFHT